MAVKFFISDSQPLRLVVTRPQAEHLLVALGMDPVATPANPALQDHWQGSLNSEDLLSRLASVRRQLVTGRACEFFGPDLGMDALVRCLLALENISSVAHDSGQPVCFEYTPDETAAA